MKRTLIILLTAPLLALLAGCIEFDEQTMNYRYDVDADTLRIFQDYRGIHAGKDPVTKAEREQLDSVLKGQRTFFFNNWITEFNREAVVETLEKLRDPARRAEMKLPEGAQPTVEKLLKLSLDQVSVENGPFYLDARGQLCGVQYVTVTKFSAVLAAGNDCALFFARTEAAAEGKSPEDKAALLKFAAKPKRFVEFDGNAMTVCYPVTAAEYEKHFGVAAKDPQPMENFRKAGVKVSFDDDLVTFQFGRKADSITSLTLPFKTDAYNPSLMELARTKHTVREAFDTTNAAQEFLLKGKATDAVTK